LTVTIDCCFPPSGNKPFIHSIEKKIYNFPCVIHTWSWPAGETRPHIHALYFYAQLPPSFSSTVVENITAPAVHISRSKEVASTRKECSDCPISKGIETLRTTLKPWQLVIQVKNKWME
jgi:hypothetical protein